MRKLALVSALTLAGLGVGAHAAPAFDLESFVEHQLFAKSMQLFGIVKPIASSSTESVDAANLSIRLLPDTVVNESREDVNKHFVHTLTGFMQGLLNIPREAGWLYSARSLLPG